MAEEGQQAREEPEPLRPEEQAGREFMAGWFDGVYSGRTSTLHRLRQDLERLALTMDEAGEIHPLTPGAPRTKLTTPHIDNPLHDPNYERGWERGFEQVTQLLLKRAATNLPRHGLSLISKHGRPFSIEDVEEGLTDLYTVRVAANRPTRLGDQSLHASLDHALQEASASPEACSLGAASLTEHFKSSLLLKTKGVLNMIREHIDRRVAIISLGTVLACGAVGFALWPSPPELAVRKSQSVSGYVAPSWLRGLPSFYHKLYGAWDMTFWLAETNSGAVAGGTSGLAANSMSVLVQAYMNQQGNNRLKRNLADFLAKSQRAAYVPDLVPGLDPAHSDLRARIAIAGALRILQAHGGTPAFSPAVQTSLVGFYQAEPSGTLVKHHLDALLTALGVTH